MKEGNCKNEGILQLKGGKGKIREAILFNGHLTYCDGQYYVVSRASTYYIASRHITRHK